ncbi:MAG: hypothetical protein Q4F79_06465 [Eubacteriales bacterium]|nr:hypothetical protein [Eubacteriales bacterium]
MKRKRLGIAILALIIVVGAIYFITPRHGNEIENHQPGSMEVDAEEHSTQDQEPIEISADAVELTNEEWQDIVLRALDCADMEAELSITPENEMTITGDLPKDTITGWLNEADEDSKGMYSSILSILPESLPTSLTCTIGCEDGKVQLTGKSMSVADIEVPMDVLDGVWSSVNENLNNSLQEKTSSINSVSVQDGMIVLEP